MIGGENRKLVDSTGAFEEKEKELHDRSSLI